MLISNQVHAVCSCQVSWPRRTLAGKLQSLLLCELCRVLVLTGISLHMCAFPRTCPSAFVCQLDRSRRTMPARLACACCSPCFCTFNMHPKHACDPTQPLARARMCFPCIFLDPCFSSLPCGLHVHKPPFTVFKPCKAQLMHQCLLGPGRAITWPFMGACTSIRTQQCGWPGALQSKALP